MACVKQVFAAFSAQSPVTRDDTKASERQNSSPPPFQILAVERANATIRRSTLAGLPSTPAKLKNNLHRVL